MVRLSNCSKLADADLNNVQEQMSRMPPRYPSHLNANYRCFKIVKICPKLVNADSKNDHSPRDGISDTSSTGWF